MYYARVVGWFKRLCGNGAGVFLEYIIMFLAVVVGTNIIINVLKKYIMGRQYESIKSFCGEMVSNVTWEMEEGTLMVHRSS